MWTHCQSRGEKLKGANFWQGKVQNSSTILRCNLLVRKSANSSPILARQWWRHLRLSLSLFVSLSLSLSLSRQAHLTHKKGSASALPITILPRLAVGLWAPPAINRCMCVCACACVCVCVCVCVRACVCHRGHYERLSRCRPVGRCVLPNENLAISQSIVFLSPSDQWETKSFTFFIFLNSFLCKITVSFTMVIKRSPVEILQVAGGQHQNPSVQFRVISDCIWRSTSVQCVQI